MNREQFDNWIKSASPEDQIHAAKVALGIVGQLEQSYRDRFVADVGQDTTTSRLFEDLKTTA